MPQAQPEALDSNIAGLDHDNSSPVSIPSGADTASNKAGGYFLLPQPLLLHGTEPWTLVYLLPIQGLSLLHQSGLVQKDERSNDPAFKPFVISA